MEQGCKVADSCPGQGVAGLQWQGSHEADCVPGYIGSLQPGRAYGIHPGSHHNARDFLPFQI